MKTTESDASYRTDFPQAPVGDATFSSYFSNPVRFEIDAVSQPNFETSVYQAHSDNSGEYHSLAGRITREKSNFHIGPINCSLPIPYRLLKCIGDSIRWQGTTGLAALCDLLKLQLAHQAAHKIHLHYFRIPENESLPALIDALQRRGMSVLTTRQMPLYRCALAGRELPLPSQRIKSKTRNTLSRKQRKLESENGEVTIRCYQKPSEADDFFSAIETLSPHTWQRHSGMGGLRDNSRFRNVYHHESSHGRMRSYLMFAGSKPIAYQFGTIYHRIYNYEILGFDQKFSEYSPGQILRVRSFDELFEEGLSFIDFGPGEYEYKSQWGTERFELFEIHLFGHSFRSKTLWAKEKIEIFVVNCLKSLKKMNRATSQTQS